MTAAPLPSSIWIVGAGSIGSFLAARIAATPELSARTHLVTRAGSHARLELQLTGDQELHTSVSAHSWETTPSFPQGSLILVATKAYQLEGVLPELVRRASPDCQFVFLQNGLGVYEQALAAFSSAPVEQGPITITRAVIYVGAQLQSTDVGSRCVQISGLGGVVWASDPVAPAAPRFGPVMTLAGIPVEEDPAGVRHLEWRKALANVAINAICSLNQVPNGVLLENPNLGNQVDTLLDEAISVAQAEGVRLTADDRAAVRKVIQLTASNFNSTVQDLRAGRPTEIPWLNGAVARLGERHGVPTPTHLLLSQLFSLLEGNS